MALFLYLWAVWAICSLLAGRPAGWVNDVGITHAPVVVRPLQAWGNE